MTSIVDTNGWDTVAAVTYADMNKAIEADAKKPSSFSMEAKDHSASANGKFGFWRLRTGGAGPDIQMELQLTEGAVTIGSQLYKIANCAFPIMVRAKFLPQDNSTVSDLRPDSDEPVQVFSFDPSQGDPTGNEIANDVLQNLLQQWLDANLKQFNVVFASVNLDADYTTEGVSWLKPSYKGYAVVEPNVNKSLDNCIFAVLCLIDGNTGSSNLAYQVSEFAIPNGAHAAFAVSAEKFLEHMMLAAVPLMFKGIPADEGKDHFVIDNDGTRIRSTTPLTLTDLKLENGNVVNPTIDASKFTIAVEGTELVINAQAMDFVYSPGIDVTLHYEGRSIVTLGADPKNSDHKVLWLKATTQTGGGSVEVSKGIRITEIVLSVVAIVAGLITAGGGAISKIATGAVTSTTEALIEAGIVEGEDDELALTATASALKGLISGSVQNVKNLAAIFAGVAKVAAIGGFVTGSIPAILGIMEAVASGDYQSMPKITDFTDNAVGKTVLWPEKVGIFKLDSAALNGALQFGLVRA